MAIQPQSPNRVRDTVLNRWNIDRTPDTEYSNLPTTSLFRLQCEEATKHEEPQKTNNP